MPASQSEFVEVFSSLFQDASTIGSQSKFRDLEEWSSMQALIVIAAIDEHYGVTIPEKDFRAAQTVADLYSLTLKP
ncbi:MAG: acyl carrier protein [Flavobacteriales bacterium]|nr:acyl carrier protein [Flavobacteriales bacterium]